MVLELSQTQLDMFAEAYDAVMRDRFHAAIKRGVDADTLQTHATGLGVDVDAALGDLYGACDEQGPERLESFVTHAVVALEGPDQRGENEGLFEWIDTMLTHESMAVDQKLSVIRQHLEACAETDAHARRMTDRIRTSLGADA